MGLTATCEHGEITVFYNGKILQRYFIKNGDDAEEVTLQFDGSDYVEFHVHRLKATFETDIADHPPICLVDQFALRSESDREIFAETGSYPPGEDRLPMLTCKGFNIETHVDPGFIHSLFFGWTRFLNTTFFQLGVSLATAQRDLKQQTGYQLLESRCKDLKAANFPITNIVVLGNGSLNTPPWEANLPAGFVEAPYNGDKSRRPGLRTVKPLPCVFQDPMTSRFEQRFLRSLGHKVVDDPDAFDLINANWLVIFIHNPGMEDYIMQGVWPAAMLAWQAGPRPVYDGPEITERIAKIDANLQNFEQAYKVLPFMESRRLSQDGLTCLLTNKYNFHLKKDLDGASDFTFTV